MDNSTKEGSDGTVGNRAAGEIFVDSIKFTDANSTDLTLKQNISVIGRKVQKWLYSYCEYWWCKR